MIKFSFLIPMYNGEQFIARCLDSLLEQDIPYDEYEIICLDDCSPDNMVEIVQSYQQRYSNIKLYRNEKNKRLATNINILVSLAKGEYLTTVGQDDFLYPNVLNTIWERLSSQSLDVLMLNYNRVNEDELVLDTPKVFRDTQVKTGIEFIKEEFSNRDYCRYILGYEWRALYRRTLWTENNIRCVDGMNYEDTLLLLKSLVYAKRVSSWDFIYYGYRENEGSMTYSIDFFKKGNYIFEFAFLVGKEEEDFYPILSDKDSELSVLYYGEMKRRYNNFWLDLIRTPIDQKRLFYKSLDENKQLVQEKKKWLNVKSLILVQPCGFYISVILGWIYKLKKKIL